MERMWRDAKTPYLVYTYHKFYSQRKASKNMSKSGSGRGTQTRNFKEQKEKCKPQNNNILAIYSVTREHRENVLNERGGGKLT